MIIISLLFSLGMLLLDTYHINNHRNNSIMIVTVSSFYKPLFFFAYIMCFTFPVLILKEGILACLAVVVFALPTAILAHRFDTSYINYEFVDRFVIKGLFNKYTYTYSQIIDIDINKSRLYIKTDDLKEHEFPYMYDNIDDFYQYALMRMNV